MRTVTFDETQFAILPIDPAVALQIGWAYVDAAREASPEKDWAFSHVGYKAMIAAAPPYPDQSGEAAEMAWIPVSERLPEMGVPVLGLTNRVDIGAYLRADTGEGDGSWIWAAFEYGYISDPRMYDVDDEYIVDAWMPLPTA